MKTYNNEQKTLPTSSVQHKFIQEICGISFSPFSNTGQKSDDKIPHQVVNMETGEVELFNPQWKLEKCHKFLLSLGINPKEYKQAYEAYPVPHTQLLVTNKGAVPVLVKRPKHNEVCMVDEVSFTVGTETFSNIRTSDLSEDDYHNEIINQLSNELSRITGFTIQDQMPKGLNYYQKSYKISDGAGIVSIGGQNDTILVQLNGTGCTFASKGWELELAIFLQLYCSRPKITRIDLAHDDFTGQTVNVDWADMQDTLGGFNCGGRNPKVQYMGDWKRPNGSGRTFALGSRKSPKYLRVYEKGKEQGDKLSNWVRVEVEFKSKGIFIPIETLVNPSAYFLAAYPCFHVMDNDESDITTKKFERIQQSLNITFDKAVDITRHQFGRYLFAFRDFYDDSELLDMLMPKRNKTYPDRLDILTVPHHFKQKETIQ